MEEHLPAEWATATLRLEETQGELAEGRWRASAPTVGPVLGKGRVVRRRCAPDQAVSGDAGPGELDEVGAAGAVAKHPPGPPGLVEHAEVAGDDPPLRLVRVGLLGPLVGERPQVTVERVERLARHHPPVVGRPTSNNRVES